MGNTRPEGGASCDIFGKLWGTTDSPGVSKLWLLKVREPSRLGVCRNARQGESFPIHT